MEHLESDLLMDLLVSMFDHRVYSPKGLTSYKNGEKDDFGVECWGIEFTSGYNQHKEPPQPYGKQRSRECYSGAPQNEFFVNVYPLVNWQFAIENDYRNSWLLIYPATNWWFTH